MSNEKNNLVYREQLDDNVIEMLSEDIGNNYSLRTENTRAVVGALNEIKGKDIISNAVGSPLVFDDTFEVMGEKIGGLTNNFKAKLLNLGVSVSNIDKFEELIGKLDEIDLGVDAEELLGPFIESLSGILEYEGVELSGNETLGELIIKVDEEFDRKNNLINNMENNLITYCDIMDTRLNRARGFAGAAIYNNNIYVLGGMTDINDSSTYIGDVEYLGYNTDDVEWTHLSGSVMSVVRANFATVSSGSKIYCVGGVNGDTVRFGEYAVFDASTHTWSNISSRPPLSTSSAVIIGNELFVFGYTSGNVFSKSIYNISTNKNVLSTTTITGHSYAHFNCDLKYVNNKFYFISGMKSSNNTSAANGTLESLEADTFSQLAYMKFPVIHSANCVYNNYIYCAGGRMSGNATGVDYIQRYDIVNDAWEVINVRLNTPRFGSACVVANDKLYCIGGFDNYGISLDTIEVCDLSKLN